MKRILLALCLLACVPAASAMSEKKEAEIGKKMHEDILAKMRTYDNPKVVDYVRRIGESLAANSDRPDID